ncbi:hypothetical protein T439DRAFT_352291 [Meredithblackwellia eburnea MCA 4105]
MPSHHKGKNILHGPTSGDEGSGSERVDFRKVPQLYPSESDTGEYELNELSSSIPKELKTASDYRLAAHLKLTSLPVAQWKENEPAHIDRLLNRMKNAEIVIDTLKKKEEQKPVRGASNLDDEEQSAMAGAVAEFHRCLQTLDQFIQKGTIELSERPNVLRGLHASDDSDSNVELVDFSQFPGISNSPDFHRIKAIARYYAIPVENLETIEKLESKISEIRSALSQPQLSNGRSFESLRSKYTFLNEYIRELLPLVGKLAGKARKKRDAQEQTKGGGSVKEEKGKKSTEATDIKRNVSETSNEHKGYAWNTVDNLEDYLWDWMPIIEEHKLKPPGDLMSKYNDLAKLAYSHRRKQTTPFEDENGYQSHYVCGLGRLIIVLMVMGDASTEDWQHADKAAALIMQGLPHLILLGESAPVDEREQVDYQSFVNVGCDRMMKILVNLETTRGFDPKLVASQMVNDLNRGWSSGLSLQVRG